GVTEFGDNFTYNASGAYGRDFADGRGNISIAANYSEVRGLLTNDRPFLANGVGGQLNPSSALAAQLGPVGRTPGNDGRVNPNIGFNDSATDGFPGTILVTGAGIPSLSRGGVIANIGALRPLDFNFQFAPDGTLVPYNRGTLFAGTITSAASRSANGNAFLFNDFTQITSNLRRFSANIFTNYQLTDNIRLFAEGLYFSGRGDELIQQQSFQSTLFGGASAALTFSVDNPLLTAQARNLLVANGYSTFRVSRINLDLGDATGVSVNDLYRFVGGADGDFKLFGRDFNFEVSGVYGRNDFRDISQQINQQNFVNAINGCVVNPAVNATPGFTPVADPNCVPLSVFGEGAPSQAAQNYVIQNTIARSKIEQWVFNANVGGSPFDLFGNKVDFNIGYEHREEAAAFNPDPFLVAGLGRSVAILP
ncbi:MAG: TonB-dependent receptor, partial [Zymomonas sp.]|nr:TonB-dependent receptor [Zymomonas sp.]